MSKIPSDEILECLYKLRIRESEKLQNGLELYDMEIHQEISMRKYQKFKTGEGEYESETLFAKL